MNEVKRQFVHWLSVLYRDAPELVDGIVASLAEGLVDEGQDVDTPETWSPDELLGGFLLSNHLPDSSRLFAVDWNDGESFIDFVDEMASRCNMQLEWSEDNLEEDLPDVLMKIAYAQFSTQGMLLYNFETGSDCYCLAVVPKRDQADFESACENWGANYRLADEPF